MIIPDSFKQAYHSAREVWVSVRQEADPILAQLTKRYAGAHYYSRLKELPSVLGKAEKGEYASPLLEMEDFFAATIVLPTLAMIAPVAAEVAQEFDVLNRIKSRQRPMQPSSFEHDDLRLILRLKDSLLRSDKSVLSLKFELQLKTLLQSAWSEAVHDVIYKPAYISWGNERIAGELRALLELADLVLAQIEATAQLLHSQAEEEFSTYKADTKGIIEIMERCWAPSSLPRDRRRMADIVRRSRDMAGVTTEDLATIIDEAKSAGDPIFDFLTITPTQKVFVLLFRKHQARMTAKLHSGRHRVLVTPEMRDFFPELSQLSTGTVML